MARVTVALSRAPTLPMIIEVLSDHPGEQLGRIDAAARKDQRELAVHRAEVARLRAELRASRRWWQIWRRLAHRTEVHALEAQAPEPDPEVAHRRAQQAAGIAAEDQMTAALSALSDDWILFRGYANGGGEVDHLLVGPGGVWAIEVKMRAVRVKVDGDAWTYEKFDRYGNLVEEGVLEDRGGRSWGRQVSDIAQALERTLHRAERPLDVQTAVVVLNERAQLGSHRDLRVDLLSIGWGPVLQRLRAAPPLLNAPGRVAVAKVVRADHAVHAARREARRSAPRSRSVNRARRSSRGGR
jgi:hypothetical protein